MSPTGTAEQVSRDVQEHPAMRYLAKGGHIAYGLIHLLLAWVCLLVAWAGAGQDASNNGALQQLSTTPMGGFLLIAVVVGLIGLTVWCAIEAVVLALGSGRGGSSDTPWKDVAKYVAKTVLYGSLALTALKARAGHAGDSSQKQSEMTAGVFGWPGGQWIVGVAALVVLGIGVYNVYRGITKKFTKELDGAPKDWEVRVGQVGHVTKGLTLGLVGVLMLVAAVRFDPAQSTGLDGALRTLQQQPFGVWLLTAAALGFACYGLYCMVIARYFKG